MRMQPMLAERERPDLSKLVYPYYASPKLDGFRALVKAGKILGRKLEPIPNKFTAARFSSSVLSGLDGELILGSPTDPQVFNKTSKALRTEGGEPDVTFWVFDAWDMTAHGYADRLAHIRELVAELDLPHVVCVQSYLAKDEAEVLAFEKAWLQKGYEGAIVRSPGGLYKYGRTTAKEATMFKLKVFLDGEFILTDVEEEMENRNKATRNKLGRTKRGHSQENMVGKGRAGTLVGVDVETSQPVRMGAGTAKDKAWFWANKEKLINVFVGKYKHFPVGVKEKRRSAVYMGERPGWDKS